MKSEGEAQRWCLKLTFNVYSLSMKYEAFTLKFESSLKLMLDVEVCYFFMSVVKIFYPSNSYELLLLVSCING